jgi:hypothetical protein
MLIGERPAKISVSVTWWSERKRYAAFVFAQSWQTRGMLSPVPSEGCSEFSESLVESGVSEPAAAEFAIDTCLGLGSSGMINLS